MLVKQTEKDLDSLALFAPSAHRIFQEVLKRWPDHARFLKQRKGLVTTENRDFLEKLSRIILSISADRLDELVDGYRWMCTAVLEEELYFRTPPMSTE